MPSTAAAARRNQLGGAVGRPASQLLHPKAASTALKSFLTDARAACS